MKKVLAYDKLGISKEKEVKEKYNEKNAGGFFKYYDLSNTKTHLTTLNLHRMSKHKVYLKTNIF